MSACSSMRASRRSLTRAEVRLAEERPQVGVELALLGGVGELERRVVVPRVLVVEDPERLAVVDVVLGEQVVVAGNRRERVRRERLARRPGRRPARRGSPAGRGGAARRTTRRYRLERAEHVEVEQEARPLVQAADRRGHAPRHLGGAERLARHRLARMCSSTIASTPGTWSSTRGPTPASAAARALWSSFARSIASTAVLAPGTRSDVARAAGLDEVVVVREPAGERRDRHLVPLARGRPARRRRRCPLMPRPAGRRDRRGRPRRPRPVPAAEHVHLDAATPARARRAGRRRRGSAAPCSRRRSSAARPTTSCPAWTASPP